jgi:hypothetical protein
VLLANHCSKVELGNPLIKEVVIARQTLKQSILKAFVLLVTKLLWVKNISWQKFTTIFLLKQDAITFVNVLPNFEPS